MPSKSSSISMPPKSSASTNICIPFIHSNASAANAVTTGIITAITTAIVSKGTNIDDAPALIADNPPELACIPAPALAALEPTFPILLASSTTSSVAFEILDIPFVSGISPITSATISDSDFKAFAERFMCPYFSSNTAILDKLPSEEAT